MVSPAGFIGQYRHALDEKGRVSVPARFREAMESEEGEGGLGLYVTVGLDRCLFAYTPVRWRAVTQSVRTTARHPFASRDARRFQRQFFASAAFCEPDAQGRILIPESLRAAAGLRRDVVFIGVEDRIEVWDAEAWIREETQGREDYERAAERALDLGGDLDAATRRHGDSATKEEIR
ncbi:MAG: division/cell wall cluster transcriptional repressor MraZ [Planctomycetales bacterium]|nr:division/cell wall cluster transcriptional repressor MraZ [Planctomycetales bacterium]